ncbi:class I histocompatibility antigen, F10 alpha chain-like isoform X2 [Thalassophryne amazonica]|uniref:class I histocompatibility antigen, F10 alpha chain-like isoform X2 n=1 Tax=Thalassophryne amazonica TaxID=390379 RepID=UPI001470ECBE|nr:class I histocompatibility antigen, F10 alpha chain-like isoform X2 [Thalassophryne amazonica]
MNILFVLFLLGAQRAAAVTHTMRFFQTTSSGVTNLPEFASVSYVDHVLISHYDSNTKRLKPKQDWMEKITTDDPQYWKRNTEINKGNQQVDKNNIETVKRRFNQTGGVHINQRMSGCEWNDETGHVNGYMQYGYDGEDFISLDLKTLTWIAPNPQAVITKHKLDNNKALLAGYKHYYTQECPEWLKKHLNYGRSQLLRTDLPSVSLLQKSPSSPVCCHATGFYPDKADIFWRKEGQQLFEDVDHGELLPNHDGTFQMSVDLNLSSVKPEDWEKYECVFQLAGVKDDIITKLDKDVIWTNHETPSDVLVPVIVAVVLLALVLAAIVGFIVYKKKKGTSQSSSYHLYYFMSFHHQ